MAVIYAEGDENGFFTDTEAGWTRLLHDPWDKQNARLLRAEDRIDKALLTTRHAHPDVTGQPYHGASLFPAGPLNALGNMPWRGLKVPAGETGYRSGWILRWHLSQTDRKILAGRTVRFITEFETSADFLQTVRRDSLAGFMLTFFSVSDASGGMRKINRTDRYPGERVEQIAPDRMRVEVMRKIEGFEATVRIDCRLMHDIVQGTPLHAAPVATSHAVSEPRPSLEVMRDVARPGEIRLTNIQRAATLRVKLRESALAMPQTRGLIFPAGVSSAGSFHAAFVPNYALPVGTRVLATFTYRTSADLCETSIIGTRIYVRLRNRDAPRDDVKPKLTALTPERLQAEVQYDVQAGESGVELSVLVNGASEPRETDGQFEIERIDLEILSTPEGHTADGVLLAYSQAAEADVRQRRDYAQLNQVTPVGRAPLHAALKTKGGGFARHDRAGFRLSPGVYADQISTTRHLEPTDYTDIFTNRPSRETLFDFRFAPGTARQADLHGFFIQDSVELRDLTLLSENSRYGIHWESGGRSAGKTQRFSHLRIRHLGADGWGSPSGIGAGLHHDQHAELVCLDVQATSQAVGMHDNTGFDAPAQIHFRGGYYVSEIMNGTAIGLNSQGSNVINRIRLDRAVMGNLVRLLQAINLSSELEDYTGDPCMFHIERAGPPVAWRSESLTDVLALYSRDVKGSSVSVSGSAAQVLFGPAVPIAGGLGYPGRVYSHHAVALSVKDIGDHHPDPSLAARLGDCRKDPLPLRLAFESEDPVKLTLDQDYRKMSNAQIVETLNAALQRSNAGQGRHFAISRPWIDRARVEQPDGERVDINLDDRVILHGHALVAVNGGVKIADAASDPRHFAGIAMRTSRPMERVVSQISGEIAQAHLLDQGRAIGWGTMLGFGSDGHLRPTPDPAHALLSVKRNIQPIPGDSILRFGV